MQGQLEHASVVPVYDLGALPDGSAFFTMKRVKGVTLEEALAGLAEKREGFSEDFSRRRLLLAFVTVCHAIEYAHARGVLHRDLKPANVMLGAFGAGGSTGGSREASTSVSCGLAGRGLRAAGRSSERGLTVQEGRPVTDAARGRAAVLRKERRESSRRIVRGRPARAQAAGPGLKR